MIEWSKSKPTRKFQVRVGHSTVVVESSSPDDAVLQARHLLCADMPRMWDVIHSLEPSRFHVEPFPAAAD